MGLNPTNYFLFRNEFQLDLKPAGGNLTTKLTKEKRVGANC
jgi:hypothetical protein